MSKEPEAATIDGELGLRDRKKARTRQQILDVASELFAEMGYENARTAAIARRAEVSEATLFRYFSSKAELAVDRQRQASLAIVSAIAARPADERPFEAVSAVARSSVGAEFFTEDDRAATKQLLTHPEPMTSRAGWVPRPWTAGPASWHMPCSGRSSPTLRTGSSRDHRTRSKGSSTTSRFSGPSSSERPEDTKYLPGSPPEELHCRTRRNRRIHLHFKCGSAGVDG
jgi:hypothetical protein